MGAATRSSTSAGHRTLRPAASLLLVAATTGAAFLVAPRVAAVNEVVVALVGGLLVANLTAGRAELAPAVSAFMLRRVLKLAVILLGAGIQLELLQAVGLPALVVIAVAVVTSLAATWGLARWQRLAPRPALLVGVGTAICGASAIAAVAPVIRARQEEIGVALATVLGFNAVALLLYPVIGAVAGLDAAVFGTWAGVAVHDTASAVATGFALGPEAGEVATVVKLARILFLLPLLAVVATAVALRDADRGGREVAMRVWRSVPWFVLGFAGLAVANSLGWLGAWGPRLSDVAKMLIVFVVAAIGLTLRLRGMAGLGRRSVLTGFGASLTIGIVSLGLIHATSIG